IPMAFSPTPAQPAETTHRAPDDPDGAGKFSVSEDWLAVVVGLVLLALALTGVIPAGLIP
ncbi:MAG: hypothetical protein L0L50_01280, partial [Propionibacterium sp.]|nr:hypothetical protein [Propionibacterium sp.]